MNAKRPKPQRTEVARPPDQADGSDPTAAHAARATAPAHTRLRSTGCSSSYHYGADLANGCGAPIYAANSGTVDYAGRNGNYGNYIRIQHGAGISTGYAHIMDGGIIVDSGQQVGSGQIIAYAGDTGRSFGCHLHFEVYIDGGYTNPHPIHGRPRSLRLTSTHSTKQSSQ